MTWDLSSLVILFLPAFICIMTKLLTVMTLNFWFIKPLATWLTWVLVISSATDICRTSASSSSGRNSSYAYEVVSPLSLPWLMDDCAANAPSNDVCDLLILCSWFMSEACNSSMENVDMSVCSSKVTTRLSNLGGRLLRIFSTNLGLIRVLHEISVGLSTQ